MAKVDIELDSYITMDVYEDQNGDLKPMLHKTVYIGALSDTPVIEEEVSLDELLQQYINNHSIPGNLTNSLKREYYEEISKGLDAFTQTIERAKEKLKSMPYWKDKNE